jgi:hypothetical protein
MHRSLPQFSSSQKCAHLWHPPCYGLDENLEAMKECCSVFDLNFSSEIQQNCSLECLDKHNECCYLDCYLIRSGIYDRTWFNQTAIENSVTRRGSVTQEDLENHRNSSHSCIVRWPLNDQICGVKRAVIEHLRCVMMQNYLNCPTVQKDEKCMALGEILESCEFKTTTTDDSE